MQNKNLIGITSKDAWDNKWHEIFHHYQQDKRHGYYVSAFLEDKDRVLEIGAGSFRDTALLNDLGIDCWGTDYSDTSVQLAKKHFPHIAHKIFQSDAFHMSHLPDKSFDVTFHNGLWVLFSDEEILRMAKEQARISIKYIIATVHNAHNEGFVAYFDKLKQDDPLYQIRFFKIQEITDLMLNVCKQVRIVPVGKGKKYFEDNMINQGNTNRSLLRSFFDNKRLDNLLISERLMCIGFL